MKCSGRVATGLALAVVFFSVCSISALGQQTVFNVPSADVLGRGKVYGEFDFAYQTDGGSAAFTPRIVVGLGHRVEAGVNVNGIGTPGLVQTTPTPAIKWKAYDGGENGWAFLVGDDVFVPAQNRIYHAGNYVYAEFAKTWKTKTRITFGGYDCTNHVVADSNRAGGQFAIEQPIGTRLTLAADWFTGHHALGFLTPGVAVKLTPKLTWYTGYQIGNSDLLLGNHQLLVELGYNFD